MVAVAFVPLQQLRVLALGVGVLSIPAVVLAQQASGIAGVV